MADADLAADAGIPTVYGRYMNGLAQPMTLNARVYGVNREELRRYVMGNPENMSSHFPKNLSEYGHFDLSGAFEELKKAREADEFHIDRDMVLCFETNQKGD